MRYVALDVSSSSTGWAVCFPGDIRMMFEQGNWVEVLDVLGLSATSKNWRIFGGITVAHGAWRLKTEWSREGDPHCLLHQNLAVLHRFSRFEDVLYEQALAQEQRGGASNVSNDINVELIGHVKSFYSAYRKAGLCRTILGIHRASWQKAFIGSMKRGTQRKTILEYIEARAEQLNFTIRKNDEAAAIGLLTYGLLTRNITPPWIENEVLRQPLVIAS